MAKLRLFANLREIAGAPLVEVDAGTVEEVLALADGRFGLDFAMWAEASHVWLNGKEALLDDEVTEDDEIVLLPPVSGGTQPAAVSAADMMGLIPFLMGVVAVLMNMQGQAVWAATLVAVAAGWAVDLNYTFVARDKLMAPLAAAATAAAGALAAHTLGGAGYGLSVALATAIVLGWAVANPEYRRVDVYSPTLLVSLLAGLGAASMILSRSASIPDERAVEVFLVAVIVGTAAGSLVSRIPGTPFIDPFSATAITAVVGSVVGAAIWGMSVVGYFLVGLGVAVALVAGSGLSSMLRTGRVSLAERSPGVLASLDGVILAAVVYYPLLRLVL